MTMTTTRLERAAICATETLIKYRVTSAPVAPLPILKAIPGVIVLSFAEMAAHIGVERTAAVHMFGLEAQDAATTVSTAGGKLRYVVAYNQRLPFYLLQRALARELGHIVLGHDGTLPDDVRTEEAIHFAKYLLSPRPLIRAIQDSGIPLTVELYGNITGCYERCTAALRTTPGAAVPPELNKLLREQFTPFVENLADFHSVFAPEDHSAIVDLGSYMDNYAE